MKKYLIGIFVSVAIIAAVIITINVINMSKVHTPVIVATDYSQSSHWLKVPSSITKKVDVFYLYPTTWLDATLKDPDVCEIDNSTMLKGAQSVFDRQATAFETVGNIFAPYYRQANIIKTFYHTINTSQVVEGKPTIDGIAAFDYYIKHYNNGRPFILAGHSQGSNVLSNLLASYMKKHPDIYKRMIAAYIIGYPVTAEYLSENKHLKFAEGPDDTGVIISFNTQAPDVQPGTNPVLFGMQGLVINPITWSRDETLATSSQGLGSFMPNPKTLVMSIVPQYADAKINKAEGVLICSTADEDALFLLTESIGRGIYHSFDYLFYYQNIRQNAANRTENFLEKAK